MGAKIEYDMRAEIFGHFQKLSFSFYDDEKSRTVNVKNNFGSF